MSDRVIDASALAFALIGGDEAAGVRELLRSATCHAPHLIDAEIGHVLRKRTASGDVGAAHALAVLRSLGEAIDHRYPHAEPLTSLAWQWRADLSFYDALYVALATRLDVPLLTGDRRLSRAPSLACAVELV